jgi:hypothetical protein
MLSAVEGAIMVGSRTLFAATLVLLVGIAPLTRSTAAEAVRAVAPSSAGLYQRGEVRVGPRVYAAPRVYAPRVGRVAPVGFINRITGSDRV